MASDSLRSHLPIILIATAMVITMAGCLDGGNQPPQCSILSSPNFGPHPLDVTFSLGASDIDGQISQWGLDVDGNGNPEYSGEGGPPSAISHQYTISGEYTPTLKVVDDGGKECTSTDSVSVL
jgi:PKD repeat protein